MTLDEAIKYANGLAEEEEDKCYSCKSSNPFEIIRLQNNSKDYRQLAEWLRELKERRNGGWISCKDRMPEVNEPVLFIFNTEGGFKTVMYGWHETIKGLGSGWHQAGVGGARADEEVTYWQPLPEPPEIGGADDENNI